VIHPFGSIEEWGGRRGEKRGEGRKAKVEFSRPIFFLGEGTDHKPPKLPFRGGENMKGGHGPEAKGGEKGGDEKKQRGCGTGHILPGAREKKKTC